MRDWTLYDGIRVAGCVMVGDNCVEQVFEAGIKPDFYSVYLHCVEGGLEAVRDFKTYKAARRYAEKLGAKRGLWIQDIVRGEL